MADAHDVSASFAVRRLLAKRETPKGITEYLCEWMGSYEPTWEPQDLVGQPLLDSWVAKEEQGFEEIREPGTLALLILKILCYFETNAIPNHS